MWLGHLLLLLLLSVNSQSQTCVKGTWTGAQNTDWNNPGNWCDGVLPSDTTMVVIPAGLTNYPAFANNAIIKSLYVEKGASLAIAADTLRVNQVTSLLGSIQVKTGAYLLSMGTNKDSITFYNIPALYSIDTLQATMVSIHGLKCHFYGVRNGNGVLQKVTSVHLSRKDDPNNVMSGVLDDSLRIRFMYTSQNGIKDTTIFKYNYRDSIVYVTRAAMDWATGNMIIREVHALRRTDAGFQIVNSQGLRVVNTMPDDVVLYGGAAAAIVIGIAIRGAIGACLINPVCASIATAAVAAFALGFAIPGLAATNVSDKYPSSPPDNPTTVYGRTKIQNPRISDCIFMVNFSYPTFKRPVYSGVAHSDHIAGITSIDFAKPVNSCGSGSFNLWSSRIFRLYEGTSNTHTLTFNYEVCPGSNSSGQHIQIDNFRCDGF